MQVAITCSNHRRLRRLPIKTFNTVISLTLPLLQWNMEGWLEDIEKDFREMNVKIWRQDARRAEWVS